MKPSSLPVVLLRLALAYLFGLGLAACQPPGQIPSTHEIGQAVGAHRPFEARLSGGVAYAPCSPWERGGTTVEAPQCSPPLGSSIKAIQVMLTEVSRSKTRKSAAGHHVRGLATLFLPPSERSAMTAVMELVESVRIEPSGCRWSDLAAAYLARSQLRDEPRDLIRALSAINQAVAARDCASEARFNLAIILERLYLDGEARDAWRDYLRLDHDSEWTHEAERRLRDLMEPSLPDLWDERRKEFPGAVARRDLQTIRSAVAVCPQAARELASEEVLGEWGKSVLEGRSAQADEALWLARAIGASLHGLHGDESLADAVKAIDRGANLQGLAQGHQAYREGIGLFKKLSFEGAAPRLAEARQYFLETGSPAKLWAEVGVAGLHFYAGRYVEAVREFQEIDRRADAVRYRALHGRVQWGLGLTRARQGLWVESMRHYRQAAAHFEPAGETENLGGTQALLGEDLRYLGQVDTAWRSRYQALRALHRFPASRRLHNVLWEAADAAMEEGEVDAAGSLQNEGVRVAQRSGDPIILAEALVRRSRVLLDRGDLAGARGDLWEASRLNRLGQGAATRSRISVDIDYVNGEIWRKMAPARALAPLSRAVQVYANRGLPLNLASALLARARANLAIERITEAEADLAAAISVFEKQHAAVRDEALYLSFLETTQGLFDEMILLQARHPDRPLAALEYSERARAVLLGTGRGRPSSPAPGRIPPGVTLVEYALIRDRLFIWVMKREGIQQMERAIDPVELDRRVKRFLDALRRGGREPEFTTASAQVFETLIPPEIRNGSGLLLFVPDKILNEVPFAALKNPRDGRYLIEKRAVGVVPSLSFYLDRQGHPLPPPGRLSALLVGEPAFDRTLFPSLPTLPGAQAEVEEIAVSYDSAEVLLGSQATRQRLLKHLDRHPVLHFAGHAIFNPRDPAASFLLLAHEDPGEPEVLFARDLADLRFRTLRWVVLSACDTMATSRTRNGELASLVRPFLGAGARSVLGTLWEVSDQAARTLLPIFHRHLAATGQPSQALRDAQLELIRSPEASLRTPSAWAAFELIGTGD
jgi:CHAT domain-containing protein